MTIDREEATFRLKLPEWPAGDRPPAPGIMVIHDSSLTMLTAPLPDKFFDPKTPKENRPKSCLDLLRLLPRNVISEIQIPDVVSAEYVGKVPTTGDDGKRYVKTIDPHRPMQGYYGKLREEFMEPILKETDGFIKIIKVRQNRPYIHDIAKEKQKLERYSDDTGHAGPGAIKPFRRQLSHVLNIQQSNNGRGEVSCDTLAIAYAIQHKAPVAVLMEGHWGHDVLTENMKNTGHSEELDIYGLNVAGLITAMEKTGILASAGITATALELNQHMFYERYRDPKEVTPVQVNYRRERYGAFTRKLGEALGNNGKDNFKR